MYLFIIIIFKYPWVYSSQGSKAKELKSKLEWLLVRNVVIHAKTDVTLSQKRYRGTVQTALTHVTCLHSQQQLQLAQSCSQIIRLMHITVT